MHQPSEHSELPPALVDDLRALGGVQAPAELWERVQAQRGLEALAALADQPLTPAPADLWDRVQAERQRTSGQRRRRILPWRHLQALSAAAAVLVLGVIGFRYLSHPSSLHSPVLAGPTDAAVKAELRARVLSQVVPAAELSASARTLATAFGAAQQLSDRASEQPGGDAQ